MKWCCLAMHETHGYQKTEQQSSSSQTSFNQSQPLVHLISVVQGFAPVDHTNYAPQSFYIFFKTLLYFRQNKILKFKRHQFYLFVYLFHNRNNIFSKTVLMVGLLLNSEAFSGVCGVVLLFLHLPLQLSSFFCISQLSPPTSLSLPGNPTSSSKFHITHTDR